MADFCTKCSEELFGKEATPEIDIQGIIEKLEPDTYISVLCEGCTMSAIGKDKAGQVYIAIESSTFEEEADPGFQYVQWITLEEHQQLNIKQ